MIVNKTIEIKGDIIQIRKTLVSIFLEESPGQGKGDLCSKYNYFVETLSDNKRIFLRRPARLNKGFDFEVNVEETSLII